MVSIGRATKVVSARSEGVIITVSTTCTISGWIIVGSFSMALLRWKLAEQDVRATRQIRLMIVITLIMSGFGFVIVIRGHLVKCQGLRGRGHLVQHRGVQMVQGKPYCGGSQQRGYLLSR